MKIKRSTKKSSQTHGPKVLASGEVTRADIRPDDVEETMLAVLEGVQALVCLAHGHEAEIIRNKAGSALVDILNRWILADWKSKRTKSDLNVNLQLLMERNEGFKKRHSELYSKPGKRDKLGAAVRSFTCELWLEMMMQESMSASVTVLRHAVPHEFNGLPIQPKPMPLFDKWALSVDAYRKLPEGPTTLDIDGAIQFARLEHFQSYWRDVFSKLAKDRLEKWWAVGNPNPSKEDAAILKNPLLNSSRFKELQAARDNPPKWKEIVNHPWRYSIEGRVEKALFDLIAPHGAARRVISSNKRRK